MDEKILEYAKKNDVLEAELSRLRAYILNIAGLVGGEDEEVSEEEKDECCAECDCINEDIFEIKQELKDLREKIGAIHEELHQVDEEDCADEDEEEDDEPVIPTTVSDFIIQSYINSLRKEATRKNPFVML
jgi:seryl-tRNA synthetase